MGYTVPRLPLPTHLPSIRLISLASAHKWPLSYRSPFPMEHTLSRLPIPIHRPSIKSISLASVHKLPCSSPSPFLKRGPIYRRPFFFIGIYLPDLPLPSPNIFFLPEPVEHLIHLLPHTNSSIPRFVASQWPLPIKSPVPHDSLFWWG